MTHGIFDEENAPTVIARADERTGTYAILVQGEVKGYFASNSDALRTALEDALDDFSVVRVEPQAA